MASDAPKALNQLGQSLWLDNITRDLLDSGTLKRYIDELSVTGLTSNPTIFDHAISHSSRYDAEIRRQIDRGTTGEGLFFNLAIQDLSRAADLFAAVHARTGTVDGFVSLEVSPLLAYDTQATVAQAKTLHAQANKPNLFIKIPGTTEGLPAIEEAIFAGVPVNVTLLFSAEQYRAAADAYLKGLERRVAAGLSPDVRSVASLFVSRWDVAVAHKVPAELRNTLGIAVGKQTYQGLSRRAGERSLPALGECRRAGAAAAVRQHRHKGQERVRYAVHLRPRGAQHGEHDAGGNAAGLRRSRHDRQLAAARRRRRSGGAAGACQGRHRRHRIGGATAIRRRQGVRRFLA